MRRLISPEMATEYQNRFVKEQLNQVKAGPVERQKRSCTDIICLVIFVIVCIIYIVFLFIFWTNGGGNVSDLAQSKTVKSPDANFGSTFAKLAGVIIGMVVLSLVLSILFIYLCAKFPKCVVYTAIITTFVIYLALIILGFVIKSYALAICFIIILLLTACMIYCYRNQIRVGIVLLQVSGNFMFQKPSVILIGLISMFINIVFELLFISGWICAYAETVPQINQKQSSRDQFYGLMVGFIFMTIYFSYFLYYLMVFPLATAVAYWYFQQQKGIMQGYKNVRKHVGSLAFAALLITIITVLRRLAQSESEGSNGAMKIFFCIIACILRCIEGFVEVLNHNSCIVMAVTGQNYIGSAKSALGLIVKNFGLFFIVDFITDFIQIYSLVFCVLIPSFIGGGIIWNSQGDGNTAAVGGFIIFLLSWIVTSVVLGILYEVLSSIFIMFCLNKSLEDQGITIGNIPEQIKNLFHDVGAKQDGFSIMHQNDNKKKNKKSRGDVYQQSKQSNQKLGDPKPNSDNMNNSWNKKPQGQSNYPLDNDDQIREKNKKSNPDGNKANLHPFYQ